MTTKADKSTPHQADVIARMRVAGRLVYVPAFWTTPSMPCVPGKAGVPHWYASIACLKAMAKRGWIVKAEGRTDYKADWILSETAP